MKLYLNLIIIGILYQKTSKCLIEATNEVPSTPFHPISQEQYDAILGLTSGEPVISEARLIASGIAALKGIAAGFKLGFSASWLPSIFSGFGGSAQENTTNDILKLQDGYPLCVVRNPDDETRNDEKTYDDDDTSDVNNNRVRPIVKCIMVIKQEDDDVQAPKPTTPAPHHHAPYPHPAPPYPYSYPWYGSYYAYTPHYSIPHGYDQQQQHQQDYVPNYRYYPNHFEAHAPQKHSKHGSSYHHKSHTHTPTRTKNRRPHPAPINYYDYTVPPPTVRRRKTKRDQYSKNTQEQVNNNYAKLTNFPAGGYQPTTYPQISYHSQYPKVAYSPSYNYPSPVYVGTTPRSQSLGSSEEYM